MAAQPCGQQAQESPFAEDEVKRGLIACEFGDLLLLTAELEEAVSQLNKKLTPVLFLRDDKPPVPCKPEPALPPFGIGIREVRQRIGRQVEDLRRMNQSCEL